MLQKFANWFRELFFGKELEIALVGLQNAGKTTLVNTMATGKFEEDTIPTIGFNFRSVKKGKVQMKMWDVGGQARFREQWEKYCRSADVIIFVVDAQDQGNLDIARQQLNQLISWPSLEGIPLLVLGNKYDLQGCITEQELITQMNLNSIKDRVVACFSISAKKNSNIDEMLKWLSKLQRKNK
ncbi:unnamed protein product (macronuclear) [Paramecium tetraurelia]|uniref:Arl_A13 protein n=1 Tax=Paramecium tetraurelia TaxID=5888 RepID=Q3SCY8_PARTE|nr:uncharacterized protein GSPATT00026094001 [Paramecium tetraurelia]CAI44577.1 arl_A13 [Paramecium tetraurelia]CAK93772.1 unnamed protein product [Paramecium tetraurelia]|eukprot:XP_001461145.1 hypothetical protein (macronuclear) [Paramecium tetraurelia strain d4-2]